MGAQRDTERGVGRAPEVCVVFTSPEETRTALEVASGLASTLTVPLTLVAFRSGASVLNEALPDPARAVVAELRSAGVTLTSRCLVCRNIRQAIPFAFSPHSLVVIGGRRSWLPNSAERLRRALEAAGHYVVFVDRSSLREHPPPVLN